MYRFYLVRELCWNLPAIDVVKRLENTITQYILFGTLLTTWQNSIDIERTSNVQELPNSVKEPVFLLKSHLRQYYIPVQG
jgi:hypothetical protein